MAYTSIWGEANSNAGKEIVDEYLERTKRSIISALKLEVLPPSDKKTLSTTEFQDLTGAINLKTKEDTNDQLILICSLFCNDKILSNNTKIDHSKPCKSY